MIIVDVFLLVLYILFNCLLILDAD